MHHHSSQSRKRHRTNRRPKKRRKKRKPRMSRSKMRRRKQRERVLPQHAPMMQSGQTLMAIAARSTSLTSMLVS